MNELTSPVKRIAFWTGPALCAGILLGFELVGSPEGLESPARSVIAVTAWVAAWWVTEAIPIPATSLLPLVLFPLTGVLSSKDVSKSYINYIILLFMAGFIIAKGVERWGLHRRIALNIIRIFGDRPHRVVLGFMAASAFLSMWISNTATALIVLPIALAVVNRIRPGDGGDPEGHLGCRRYAVALLLGVAYGSSIGGTGTLIGSPPNLVFARQVDLIRASQEAAIPAIDFQSWLVFGIPTVVIFIPLAYLVLVKLMSRFPRDLRFSEAGLIRDELKKLGPMSSGERRMLLAFLVTSLLWITKGSSQVPGWSRLLVWAGLFPPDQLDAYATDSLVAVTMAIILFTIPVRTEKGTERLMNWECAVNIPWGMLLLFGGGFAIADGFQESGLSAWIGRQMGMEALSPSLLVLISGSFPSFLTEFTSNTATAQILMPILASASEMLKVHPFILMLPATLSVSFAFMLPVSTPPNAIIFSSGRISIRTMVWCGFLLDLIGVLVVFFVVRVIAAPFFGIGF